MNSIRHCSNCFILRCEVEDKDKRIVDLQQEVQRLHRKMEGNQEYFLQSENEMIKKKLNKSVKWLTGLTGRYFEQENVIKKLQKEKTEQENVIKKLQKEKIEVIGKVLISFIYNQSDWKS